MAESRKKKRLKSEEKEDRISALPDCLLQHILSFLPSTEDAIRTGILSKRWMNQWTHVQVLIFNFYSGMSPDGYIDKEFATFIDNALLQHDCPKIKKLHLAYNFKNDTNFYDKIRFVTRKHVEELILNCYLSYPRVPYSLPEFLFDNASLVKLEIVNCVFMDARNINWGSLKALKMEGSNCDMLDANFLSGSQSLESLEVNPNGGSGYVIASKSLKTLMLAQLIVDDDSEIQILCPNLEKLYVQSSILPRQVIENVVSCCPLLTSLEVRTGFFEKLVITSNSLRKLVLRDVNESCALEISCPKLEEFHFYDSCREAFDLVNDPTQYRICPKEEANKIFEPLQNVKVLTLGSWFIKILSDVEMEGLSYAWSKNKILTLHRPHFEHLPGIICALRSSPALEGLVIKLHVYKDETTANLSDLNASGENYLILSGTVGNGLLSHLKTVAIIGLSEQDAKCKLVLDFIKFVLENARVLEKFVLVISKDGGKDFALAVARKVHSFPRCSQHVIVELF